MENIDAVDTTLFYHNDKWWLFTNIIENQGSSNLDELFLFFSDDFITNSWVPHPRNPIISDVKKARSAGNIFVKNGRIIRPSQNSSLRYGYGIKLNEIKILNENEYEEIEIDSIEPNWDSKILGTHTINNSGNLSIIDGILKRRKFL